MKKKILFLLLISILTCNFITAPKSSNCTQRTYFRESDLGVYIGNGFIEVGFRKDTGALWSVLDKASGVELRGLHDDPKEGLWDIRLLTKEEKQIGSYGVSGSQSYYQGYSIKQTQNEVELTLEWNRIWIKSYGEYPERVLAMIKMSDLSQFANFSLTIENKGDAAIEEVHYPIITGISKLGNDSSDDILVVPDQNGRLFYDPSTNLDYWGWEKYPSGFMNMQFMAYYDTHSGFYIATYDQNANTKSFVWEKMQNSGVRICINHYPSVDFGSSYTLSYDVVLRTFEGDWQTAADIYKEWALKQWWSRDKKLISWLNELGTGEDFQCYQDSRENKTFEECIQYVKQGHESFTTPTLLNLWGWENGGAWSYGSYFPPIEGWNKFDELIAEAHKANTKVWVYIGASGVTADSEQWMNGTARPYAVIGVDNSYFSFSFTNPDWEYMFICPYTDYWQNYMKDTVLTLVKHGVDIIQFDNFPWNSPQPCYDSSHGHPVGLGSNWYARSWFSILNETRKEATSINPNIMFSGEGGAEVFNPFLDTFHSRDSWAEVVDWQLHEKSATVIPLYNYVYNKQIFFIGQHNLGLGGSYNRLGLSRTLVWNELPCLSLVGYDDRNLEYLMKIGYARTTYASDFLSYSKPIKTEEIKSPIIQVQNGNTQEYNVSSIQYGAWVADDGRIGYILTNIADFTVKVESKINTTLTKPYTTYLVRDGNLNSIKSSKTQSYNLSLEIKPLEIILLVFNPGVLDSVPPEANAGSDITIQEGGLVTFDASLSRDNLWLMNYTWTFNDGAKTISLHGLETTYLFTTPGNYPVKLNVNDMMNNSDTDILSVTVLARPPDLLMDPYQWEQSTWDSGQVTRDPKLTITGSPDYNISGAEVHTIWRFIGDFDVQVDYREGEGWGNPEIAHGNSPVLEAARMGINMEDSTWSIRRMVLLSDPPGILHYISIDSIPAGSERLFLYDYGTNVDSSGKFRIIRTGSDVEFQYYSNVSKWVSVCIIPGITKPVSIFLSASTVWTNRILSTIFENFQINSGKIDKFAHFELSGLKVEPTQIIINSTATVSVNLKNSGNLTGNYNLELKLNGVAEQSRKVSLEAGSQTQVSFTVNKATAGDYSVEVGQLKGSFTVKTPPRPADIGVKFLVISKALVKSGEEVTVNATLENTGELPGNYTIVFTLDGVEKGSFPITLDGGETTSKTIKISNDAIGVHQVSVDDKSVTLEVIKVDTGVPGYPVESVLIGLMLVVVILTLRSYRRASRNTGNPAFHLASKILCAYAVGHIAT